MGFFDGRQPFIIAGPCSAETEEQVVETAEALSGGRISLFRAGVWKPRTRPGSFEGHGEAALRWLQTASQSAGLPFATEVAEPAHIELALKYGVAAVWIGARTTVNPFQVQKLADALKGCAVAVMVKNPVSPDIGLWQGAIERVTKAGIHEIAAVHRGFTAAHTTGGYRNPPNWLIPVELKRRLPGLPIFCDPSHITGDRDKVAAVAQKALDMRFDGLMIETHPDPDHALTDAAQQITPQQLFHLLDGLTVRSEFTADMEGQAQLEQLRQMIDSVDEELVRLLARRMQLCDQLGWVKKACNMTVYQPERWREIVDTVTRHAATLDLSAQFVHQVYERIHHESIRTQLLAFGREEKQAT